MMHAAQVPIMKRSRLATLARDTLSVAEDVLLYGSVSFVGAKVFQFCFYTYHAFRSGEPWFWHWMFADTNRPWTQEDLIATLPSALLWAPLVETLLFFLTWRFCTVMRLNEYCYAVLSAAWFSAMHMLILEDAWAYTMVSTFLGGLFLAAIFAKRARFDIGVAYLACALAHSYFNFLILVSTVSVVGVEG